MTFILALVLGFMLVPAAQASIVWDTTQLHSVQCDQELPFVKFQNNPDYSHDNAALFLWANHILEQYDDAFVEASMQRLGFSQIDFINPNVPGGSEALIATSDDVTLVVFRGSRTFRDAIIDAKFFQKNSKLPEVRGKLHTGIYNHFFNMRQKIEETLLTHGARKNNIYVSGHSLGGGLAQLTGLYLVKRGFDIASVYTSASPRIGDAEFMRDVEVSLFGKVFSLITEKDVVPQLPPTQWFAQEFAEVLPGESKLIGKIKNLVDQLNYDFIPGTFVYIPKTAQAKTLKNIDKMNLEVSFWKTLKGIVDQNSLIGVIQDIMDRFGTHAPEGYLCKLAHSMKQ